MDKSELFSDVLEIEIPEEQIGWEETSDNYDIIAGCAPNCKPECSPGCRPDCGPHNQTCRPKK